MIEEALIIKSAYTADGGEDFAAEARARYKAEFPGRAARRMTHLGMLVALCIRKVDMRSGAPVIYASAFAESCSLENFIDSFPQASPMLFQTSIHPSAVEQALIPKQNALRRFYPITSVRNLAGQALENASLLAEDEIVVVGGEEKGTWLCPFGLASDRSFAFALRLARGGEGVGRVRFEASPKASLAAPVELPDLWKALAERSNLTLPSVALEGWLHLEWE